MPTVVETDSKRLGRTVEETALELEKLLPDEPGDPSPPAPNPEKTPEEVPAPVPPVEPEKVLPAEPEVPPAAEPAVEGSPAVEPATAEAVTVAKTEWEELKASGLRTADYTKKSQANAELRKQLDAELEAVRTERATHSRLITELEQNIKLAAPDEPNWADLKDKVAPEEYKQARSEWDAFHARVTKIRQDKESLDKQQAEDQAKVVTLRLQDEHDRLLKAVPEWTEPTAREKAQAELAVYAKSVGFSEDELKSVADHRAIVLLRKAMLYDRLQAKAPAIERKVIKTAPPGSVVETRPARSMDRAMEILKKSGRPDDAAKYFETILK